MAAKYKSDFLNVLDQRGFIAQVSDPEGLDALAAKGQITGYVGYDATATSIHIGNLITVTLLYWLQETGHKAISLMGGGTSMVGDPSGPRRPAPAADGREDQHQHREHQARLRQHPALRRPQPGASWSTMPTGC